MDSSKNHHGLGVNKAIKKETAASHRSPLPRQPRVYNIRRSDFRSVVQQLTGSSSTLPRPRRLHQARPPPLSPVPRTSVPAPSNPPVLPPAESPLSAYMRFVETSLLHSDGSHLPAASPLRPPPLLAALDFQSPSPLLDLLSPGPFHHPLLPLSPNMPFSPLPLQPPSPSMLFPHSPSGFFTSPTWKDL